MRVPLDLNGPTGRTFDPWPDSWTEQGIIHRFNAVVAQFGDRLALDDGRDRLTYDRLALLARHLSARIDGECRPGAIGILQPHSAAFWVAIFACIGTGRSYVALDLHHPAQRNAAILRDAGLSAVIVPPRLDPAAATVPNDLPSLRWTPAEPVGNPPDWPCRAAPSADRPAIILYTSGSTGQPKGIANSQQALLQRVAQYVNACHLDAGDRMLTLSSPCTIAGTREGLTALLIGATLHIADPQRNGLGEIARRIGTSRVTICNAVPTMLRALMSAPDAARNWRSVRAIRVGGDVVFWTDIAQFRRVLPPDCHIQIGYSATEFTGTQWFVPKDAEPDGAFVPVGYVMPGNGAAVVNDFGAPVPPGGIGELVLRGRFIALGVWHNGRCIPGSMPSDPQEPGARLLHTGDLVHIDATGLCTVTGRKDRQVKINGVRVEPSELEAALRALPGIDDAAVLARHTGPATSLAAFVVPRGGWTGVAGIHDALRTAVPPAMRPARVHVLEAMPRLPSAKLDIQALRALDAEPSDDPVEADTQPLASDDALQAVLKSWRAVLGRHALDGNRSFDAAGGDSLRLLQFVLWLETLIDHPLPLELFNGDMRAADAARAVTQAMAEPPAAHADRRPLVHLFPGVGGDEPRLAQFRAALQDRLRFAVILYPDWPDMVRCDRRFETLVNLAVSQITARQPNGAVLLAGYSFGSDVAWAAIRRLSELGRVVRFLGILDADLDRVMQAAVAEQRGQVTRDSRQLLRETAYDRLHASAGFLLSKLLRDGIGLERAARYQRWWRPLLPRRTGFALDHRTRLILRLQMRWRWSRSDQSQALAVPAVLFRSTAHASDASADLGWRARCSRLSVVPVAGDHRSMLEPPHRPALCDRFAEAVAVALQSEAPSVAHAEPRDASE